MAKPFVSEKFKESYKKLNKEQREAVDTIEGPVMVVAGPGTGKTQVLTLRIANILIQTDTPPSGILALTYSDAGVKAMRERLQDIIGDRAHEVNINTFHGFAREMMNEYPDHFLHVEQNDIITDIETESLIRSIIEDSAMAELRPIGKPDAYLSAIIHSIDDAKREALLPADVRKFALEEIKKIENDEASISTRGATKGQLKAEAKEKIEKCKRTLIFANAYERYEEEKRRRELIDFNDLIFEFLTALKKDELLLRLIQERFLYILVDEHQDTNDAQNFIVSIIAEFFETPNIFIVGDEKQAIYRFQGASVENFHSLRDHWPAMKLISLSTNYRSHQKILDAAFAMIENNYNEGEHQDLRIKLKAGKSMNEKPVEVAVGENVEATELQLVQQLKKIVAEEPDATVAIIVRRNRDIERILRLLESHDVPVASERSVNIFNHPIGSLFFDLLEYLADPCKIDALARTIVAGMWNIPFDRAITILREARSGQTENLEKDIPVLAEIKARMHDDNAVGFIIHAAELSGFADIVAKDPASVPIWRGIVALAESIGRERHVHEPLKLIEALLEYRLSSESRTVKVSVGAPDLFIKAMTAHGSKGLEFDYVFMPYATEESWIGRTRGASFVLPQKRSSDSDITDLRRLFYVALTRARKHAVILVPAEESDGKILEPLRFISELGDKNVSFLSISRTKDAIPSPFQQPKRQSEYGRKMTDIAKRSLLENGLSVTALNHFLKCPNEFLYSSILRMPQALSASAEKGNAMHSAISLAWQEKEKNKIEETLISGIGTYLDASFLLQKEKEAVRKELLENAPAVAAALESHFISPVNNIVLTEHRINASFSSTFENKEVTFPIHGNLDAVLEEGSKISIFDYKTKQAMSLNEIKGLTKNSDGGYFRQLVFYKILADGQAKWKGKNVNAALVFVSPDSKGRCPIMEIHVQDADVEKVKEEIKSLIDAVWSGKIAENSCQETNCSWCGLARIRN